MLGLLAGAGLTAQIHKWSTSSLNLCLSSSDGLRQLKDTQPDLVLAFTLYPVTTSAGQLAVIAVAVAVLIGFLLWTKRETSTSFFWGVLAGTGFVLSFDIVWVHWIFGLHHITNTQMDLVLEPLFVLLGVAFLWFGITRERRRTLVAPLR
jgi:drug/metabolite transporter (DMT)-like permease